MKTDSINSVTYSFMFDLIARSQQIEYFKMKNKHGYAFSQEEKKEFKDKVNIELKKNPDWVNATAILVPGTSNEILKEIAFESSKKVYFLEKASISEIIPALQAQSMMKGEAQKLLSQLKTLESIKMADIAGNQRKRFIGLLFKNIDNLKEYLNNEKIVFLDDSVFSGITLQAAHDKIKDIPHTKIVFYNKR